MKKLVALLIAMLTILAVAVPAMAYTQTSVSGVRYIYASNGNPVNVRTGPGTSYNLANCGTLPVGTKVNLVAKSTTNGTDWYKIVAANDSSKNGWVMGKFLSTTASGSGSGDAKGWEARYGTGNLSTAGGNSTSAQIRNFQEDLNSIGYVLDVDGYYGTKTKDAVKEFQKDYGLSVDGIAGPATKAKLYTESGH